MTKGREEPLWESANWPTGYLRGLSLRQRFERRVRRGPGCWNWIAGLDGNGYAGIYDPSTQRNRTAARVAYELFIGEIPKGLMVCHRCDNRLCVNPSHLYLGTNSDNQRDAFARGGQRDRPRVNGKFVSAQLAHIARNGPTKTT